MVTQKTAQKKTTKKKSVRKAAKKAVKRSKKNAVKRARKSAKKTATGKPFKKGDDPRRGKGPPKGAPNAGRPPDAFKREMRETLWSQVVPKLKKLTKNAEGELLLKIFRELADRGYGRAPMAVEIKEDLSDDERMQRMQRFLRVMVERDPDGMKPFLTTLIKEVDG